MSASSTCDEKGFKKDWLIDFPASLGRIFDAAFGILRSLPKTVVAKSNDIDVSGAPVHTVLFFRMDDGFFDIDPESITELVKGKHLDQFQIFGGIPRIASAVKTDIGGGLDGSEETIVRQRQEFGSNTYEKPPSRSFGHFFMENFLDFKILILLACAALSLVFGIREHGFKKGWYDGGSMFVATFICNSVFAATNYRQYRQREKHLSHLVDNIQTDVVRNGRLQQISLYEIVVGDVICLKSGDQVPADGLFLDGHSLQVDESSITGGSSIVEVNGSQNPFLLSGSMVVNGYARMIATAVGMNTKWGRQMSQVPRVTSELDPLQAPIWKLCMSTGLFGLAVSFFVLLVLLVRYFTGKTTGENGNRQFGGSKTKVDDIVNAVVGIVAAAVIILAFAIPEDLLLTIMLNVTNSIKGMMADNVMVRNLSAAMTMGSTTIICTDKTGTLTLNQMVVTEFWLGLELTKETNSIRLVSPSIATFIREGVALNTTGGVYLTNSGENEISVAPTEKAILSWAITDFGMDKAAIEQSCTILQVEEFNSVSKLSGVMMRKETENTIHVHWKGAAEIILSMCSSYYDASGNMIQLGDDDYKRKRLELIIQDMAARSLRCVAFAHKHIVEEGALVDQKDNLCLLGLVGLKDPCRPGVKDAVNLCRCAGVKLKMITGDSVSTAITMATECGILEPNQNMSTGAVVVGEVFRNYTPEERMEKVDQICVMARSSPSDKLRMVQSLKEKGHVVAATGDGISDAPFLKEADIGLSKGIHGTEVTKQSSDIVILDDNFASVVKALRWGRCVNAYIQKLIQFQLLVSVAVPIFNLVAAVFSGKVPLTVVQLLWVNMTMLTLGALALAIEKPTDELMHSPPVGRSGPFVTNIVWRNLLVQATYQIVVVLTLHFRGESIFGVHGKKTNTLIFNTFVLCQVFNVFNARKLENKNVFKGIQRNKLFLGIILIIIVLQVLMVELLNKFEDRERLNWGQWGACIIIAAVSWPLDWVVKCIPVPKKPFFSYLKCKE